MTDKEFGKTILILEGVAGSGKTTLTSALESISGIGVVRSSLGKRSFGDNYEPATKSQANDYLKLVRALNDDNPVVIIERLMLSQCVYGSIRSITNDNRLYHSGIAHSASMLINAAINEHEWRHAYFPPREYNIGWIVIAPHPNVIQFTRNNRAKEYPHNGTQETYLYRLALKELSQNGEIATMLPPENIIDIGGVHSVFSEWMKRREYWNTRGLFNNLTIEGIRKSGNHL